MNNQSPEKQSPNDASPSKSERRPFLKGVLAGGLVSSLLAVGASVFANSDHQSHFWKAGACRQGHAMRDPAVMQERASFMADWVLKRVNATDEQSAQVKATLQATINDLLELRNQHYANRDAMRTALTKPTIDRAELERIRSAEMQLANTASTKLIASIADMADVLDPQQRQAIADMGARWSGHRHEM